MFLRRGRIEAGGGVQVEEGEESYDSREPQENRSLHLIAAPTLHT